MTDTTYNEFPFVAEMPKREKTKFAKVWDTFQEFRAATREHGCLLPPTLAANVLGVSRQRVMELGVKGSIVVIHLAGRPYVGEKSLIEHARTERKAGRPYKLPETTGDVWRASRAAARGVELEK